MADPFNAALQKFTPKIFRPGGVVADAVTMSFATTGVGFVPSYTGFSSVTINQDLDAMASSFSATIADRWRTADEKWPMRIGTIVSIYIGETIVLRGFIDSLSAEVTNEDRRISFSGRHVTADLVDSTSLDIKTSYAAITFFDLVKTLTSSFDIKVVTDVPEALTLLRDVKLNQGETIFNAISKYAKKLGVLLVSGLDNELRITNRGGVISQRKTRTKDFKKNITADFKGNVADLQQGKNIISASANYDEKQRFQKYIIKSQIQSSRYGNSKESNKIAAVATDPLVARSRVKYIQPPTAMTDTEAQTYAEWMANLHAAGSTDLNVVVQGWKDANGNLWQNNTLVSTDLRFVGIKRQMMLIVGVQFSQDSNGTMTTLRLTRLDGFQAQPIDPEVKDPSEDQGWDAASDFGLREVMAKSLGFK